MHAHDSNVGTAGDIAARVASIDWYHTFDLPGGLVTPGYYDHRSVVGKIPWPDLTGKRCLDVASADGFFAYEMKRRGAAEVVSVDLADTTKQDWQGSPVGTEHRGVSTNRAATAFRIVGDATGLEVDRRNMSIYDVSPEELGTFDFVFKGNILLHLADPARALWAIHSVCDGQLLSFEQISLWLTVLRPRTPMGALWYLDEPRWWTPNMAAHRRQIAASGFEIERAGGPLFQRFGAHMRRWPTRAEHGQEHPLTAQIAYWTFVRRVGCPTSWVIARPIR